MKYLFFKAVLQSMWHDLNIKQEGEKHGMAEKAVLCDR